MAQAMMKDKRDEFAAQQLASDTLAKTPVALATGTLSGESAAKVAKMLQGTAIEFATVLAMRGM